MQNLFTYPLNAATFYTDPTYYGDANSGYYKRVEDYVSGNYILVNGPPASGTACKTFLGKYHNYVLQEGQNNLSRFGWSLPPWVEGTWYAEEFPVLARITRNGDPANGLGYCLEIEDDLVTRGYTGYAANKYHTIAAPDQIWLRDITTDGLGNGPFYYRSTAPAAGAYVATPNIIWVSESVYNTTYTLPTNVSKPLETVSHIHQWWVRTASGSRLYIDPTDTPTFPGWKTDDVVRLRDNFTNASHTGTVNDTTADRYINRISDIEFELFTDSAKTTPATLNELYVGTYTFNITTTASVWTEDLVAESIGSWGTAIVNWVAANPRGFCRITYTVNSGSMQATQVDSITPIETSISYNNLFYYDSNSLNNITIYDYPGSSTNADFTVATNSNVDITIHFIEPGQVGAIADGYTLMQREYDPGFVHPYDFSDGTNATYFMGSANVIQKGNRDFYYYVNDGSGNAVLQASASLADYFWGPGGTSQEYWNGTKPAVNITVNGSGQLDSVSISDGGRVNRDWIYSYSNDSFNRALAFWDSASDFIPTTSTLETEESFDSDDEWDTTGYDTLRIWPKHIKPRTAEVTLSQPSSVTLSQNGIKYVKDAGYTSYQIKLSYPPMTHENFKLFEAFVEATRGQVIPFQVDLEQNDGSKLLFRNNTAYTTSVTGRTGYPQADGTNRAKKGDKVILFDGFPDNEVINKGDHVIIDGLIAYRGTGNLAQVINSPQANVFGEMKVRFPRGIQSDMPFHGRLFRDPNRIIVTLGADNFQWNKSLEGYYSFDIVFDADEFK